MHQRPILLAHRGAHDQSIRENSLAALVAGARECDGVELDVRFSAEGEAVIVHDPTLDRLFGVTRPVCELSAAELANLEVPTLLQVLAAMPATTLVDLELKERPSDALFSTIVEARGPEADGIVISSFDPDILQAVATRVPSWPRWLNAETAAEAELAMAIGCEGISVDIALLSNAHIRQWLDAGLEIAAWTIRNERDAFVASDSRIVALCVEGDGVAAARAVTR
jgi:glycerophosphoryl diester phosphodiesterase